MSIFQAPWYTPAVQRLLDLTLEEDAGRGDVTSAALIDEGQEAEADIIAKERLVVCGLGIAEAVFTRFDWRTRMRTRRRPSRREHGRQRVRDPRRRVRGAGG